MNKSIRKSLCDSSRLFYLPYADIVCVQPDFAVSDQLLIHLHHLAKTQQMRMSGVLIAIPVLGRPQR